MAAGAGANGPHRPRLARNTLLNLFGNGIPLLVGVFTMPTVVRYLGPERFGILSLSWVLLGYANLFDLGLSRALTKFLAEVVGTPEESERGSSLFWTAMSGQIGLSIAGAGVLILLTPALVIRVLHIGGPLRYEAVHAFYWVAVCVPIVLTFNSARGALEAAHRFDVINGVRAPFNALNFLIPFFGALQHYSLVQIVALLGAARVLSLIVMLFFCRLHLSSVVTRWNFSMDDARRMIGFGGWVTASGTVSPLLSYLDRLVLGSIAGVASVGYYSAPNDIVSRLIIIPSSLAAVLYPTFSAASTKSSEQAAALLVRCVKYLLLVIAPIVLILIAFSSDILTGWLGADYARQSGTALQILALGILINSLAIVPYTMLQGIGRPDIPAKFHLLELPIQFVAVVICVHLWGITGAAAAWAFRVTLDAMLLFWAVRRVAPLSWVDQDHGHTWKALAGVIALSVLCALASVFVPLGPRAGIALVTGLALLYQAWQHLLSSDERGRVRAIVRRRHA